MFLGEIFSLNLLIHNATCPNRDFGAFGGKAASQHDGFSMGLGSFLGNPIYFLSFLTTVKVSVPPPPNPAPIEYVYFNEMVN